jgi:Chaperone of endosialidase
MPLAHRARVVVAILAFLAFSLAVPVGASGGRSSAEAATSRSDVSSGKARVGPQSEAAAQGSWSLTGNAGTDASANFLGTTDNQSLVLKVNGLLAFRLQPTASIPNVLGGIGGSSTGVQGATIAGGGGIFASANVVRDNFGVIGGGFGNRVGNGGTTTTDATLATVAGGGGNRATGQGSTVGGGGPNTASANLATVAGGTINTASGIYATVGGGISNTASAQGATVPGGIGNRATGPGSFAAGTDAVAPGFGTFVWADWHPDFDFLSSTSSSFNVRSTGGVRFVSACDCGSGGTGNPTAGVKLSPGGGSWSSLSDRRLKEDLHSVNLRWVLRRVARMRVSTWRYTAQDPSIRHMGPMAQDFFRAFHLGESDRYIDGIDAEGVALAAIKGIYRELMSTRGVIEHQRAEIRSLRARLDRQGRDFAKLENEVARLAAGTWDRS